MERMGILVFLTTENCYQSDYSPKPLSFRAPGFGARNLLFFRCKRKQIPRSARNDNAVGGHASIITVLQPPPSAGPTRRTATRTAGDRCPAFSSALRACPYWRWCHFPAPLYDRRGA